MALVFCCFSVVNKNPTGDRPSIASETQVPLGRPDLRHKRHISARLPCRPSPTAGNEGMRTIFFGVYIQDFVRMCTYMCVCVHCKCNLLYVIYTVLYVRIRTYLSSSDACKISTSEKWCMWCFHECCIPEIPMSAPSQRQGGPHQDITSSSRVQEQVISCQFQKQC